jgi:hypothetical protein
VGLAYPLNRSVRHPLQRIDLESKQLVSPSRGRYAKVATVSDLPSQMEKAERSERVSMSTSAKEVSRSEKLFSYRRQSSSAKISRITNCGRPLRSFDETLRTSLASLASPCNLWASERLEDKKKVLKLARMFLWITCSAASIDFSI